MTPLARKFIPFLVAAPMFLQNLTSTVLATALPSIAKAIGSEPLHLNLAITIYLLAVAVTLPLAAWLADRVGQRRLFCIAMCVFALGSLLSACSQVLWQLAASRALQGVGGALMLPLGRLILLRSIPPNEIVKATIWYTVPPALGSIAGPLVGAAIVTYASWPWLFLINIPVALLAVYFSLRWLSADIATEPIPFNFSSYLLLALALLFLLSGFAGSGKDLLPVLVCAILIGIGLLLSWGYLKHAKHTTHPVLNFALLRFPTLRASILGGNWIRIGQAALPFALPLMFQLGFGMSAITAGLLLFVLAAGSLLTRPLLTWAIARFGFRQVLIGSTLASSLGYLSFAFTTPNTPLTILFILVLITGAARGILMVSMNTLGYSEIPKTQLGHATAISSMSQQVAGTLGVALIALLLSTALQWRGANQLAASDFTIGFIVMAALNACALFYFLPLSKTVGAEMLESDD